MEKLPSKRVQSEIRRIGTTEQIKRLEEQLKAAGQADPVSTKKATHYFKNLTEPEEPGEEEIRAAARRFFKAKLYRGAKNRPEQVNYDLARKLFWDRYCDIVWEESKLDLIERARQKKTVLDGNAKVVISNFCYWILGLTPEGGGGFDPDKSIILWGNLGTGKSTIGRAGESVLAYFRKQFNWDETHYSVTNMDKMFLELIATQSTKSIGEMGKGNLMIDELKEKHFSYKHYGNDIPIINTTLAARHEEWKWNGKRTIITTNIAKPRWAGENSIFQDARLEDRIQQEYQFVELRGTNKRSPAARL